MNDIIKQRIDVIQKGGVPDGYKKVKAGIVPADWKETHFKTMFGRLNRKNTTNNTNVLTISAQHGLISQEDFFNKSIASEDKSNYVLLKLGEFAYNKSYSNGYPFGAIKPLVAYESGIVSPLYICFSATKENKCPEFYAQYFEGGLMNHEIQAFAQEGARNHGLLNISVEDFFNSAIIVPPLLEQKKIAKILITCDKMIELKEKRISEKQQQKKYLMQQLLTGKKRLKGFSDEWGSEELMKIAMPISEKVGQRNLEVLSISANIGFVNQSEKFGRQIAGEQYINYTVLHKGDFSYNKGNSKKYPQGCIYLLEDRDIAAVPNVFYSFKLNDKLCYAPYYKFLFESGYLNKQLLRLINFGVRNDGLLNLYERDFYQCSLPLPTIDEQIKIATILQYISDEISLFIKDLEQERQKKKALMQLLLTGIVHVSAE